MDETKENLGWETSLRDYPQKSRPNRTRRKPQVPTFGTKQTSGNITDNVIKSLVAQAEDEVETIEKYCRQVTKEQVGELQERFEMLDTTINARLVLMEESVSSMVHEMHRLRTETYRPPPVVENLFSSSGQGTNLENVLMKIETLIGGLLDDMGRQGKELASWRSKFREIGLEVPFGDDDDASFAETENIFTSLSRLEMKLLNVERDQRDLNEQQYSTALKNREFDEHEAARTKDRQHLESKIAGLSEQVASLNTRLNDVQRSAVSEDVLMHTHLGLLNQMQADHTTLKKKIKALGTNTAKACRSLDDGLNDVQGISVELLAYCDKVQEALLTAGVTVPREVLPENPSRSQGSHRTRRSKPTWDWETDDDG